ncbi:GtrA family protein [Actinomycetes bacterium M1A6_2h]
MTISTVTIPGATRLSTGVVTKLRSDSVWSQLVRFAAVGGSSNGVYVALFAMTMRYGSIVANLAGVVVSTVLATELHRRLTFHAASRVGWFTAQWEGGGLALVGLVTSYVALAVLHSAVDAPGWVLSAAVVIGASAAAGLVRFVALRGLF